ncbi:tetratricopeptide repeat protein [Saccharicrinis sp. FJH62]|uniref:tetratricopeptide repeat protein n=1 Tax=Saccharicrinis sp. FJH62 TaxID=3344657 RepID=UPI0035D41FB2
MNQDSFMIRLKNSLLFFLLFFSLNALSQTAYDFEHSLKFGQYLFNTNQYNLAAQEFERAVYFQPQDSVSNFMLFKTYSILNQKDKALIAYRNYSKDYDLKLMPDSYGTLYASLLIKDGDYDECMSFIEKNCCLSYKSKYIVSTRLVEKDWQEAWDAAELLNGNEPNISPLLNLVDESKNLKLKHPALGAVFSAIIPGTGKVYAGAWQDGLVGFFMTSISGLLAYRAYDKYGIKNPYTWFLGAMAVGYYSGNVYGGYNTVRKYNLSKEDEIVNKTKLYISDF